MLGRLSVYLGLAWTWWRETSSTMRSSSCSCLEPLWTLLTQSRRRRCYCSPSTLYQKLLLWRYLILNNFDLSHTALTLLIYTNFIKTIGSCLLMTVLYMYVYHYVVCNHWVVFQSMQTIIKSTYVLLLLCMYLFGLCTVYSFEFKAYFGTMLCPVVQGCPRSLLRGFTVKLKFLQCSHTIKSTYSWYYRAREDYLQRAWLAHPGTMTS